MTKIKQPELDVSTFSTAHMAAEIRAKQLSTKTSQDNLLTKIAETQEDITDVSGTSLVKKIEDNISLHIRTIESTNKIIAFSEISSIGYPIKFNKTIIQLKLALEWIQHRGEQLITDIRTERFL